MSAIIKQANVYEDGSAQVMARVLGNDASAVTQSSISSGTYTVHDYYLNTEHQDSVYQIDGIRRRQRGGRNREPEIIAC